jgi:hypothetical protein
MGLFPVFATDTHVSLGMKTTACGPVTDRLSPTVTVAPPSSKMATYRMEFDVEGASKLLDTYFAGSEVKAAQFYRAL